MFVFFAKFWQPMRELDLCFLHFGIGVLVSNNEKSVPRFNMLPVPLFCCHQVWWRFGYAPLISFQSLAIITFIRYNIWLITIKISRVYCKYVLKFAIMLAGKNAIVNGNIVSCSIWTSIKNPWIDRLKDVRRASLIKIQLIHMLFNSLYMQYIKS